MPLRIFFTLVTDHVALWYLCTMQDTSNTLPRWAIAALQQFDFMEQRTPGRSHVVPYFLSRLLHSKMSRQKSCLASLPYIARNVSDDPKLQIDMPNRQYQVNLRSETE